MTEEERAKQEEEAWGVEALLLADETAKDLEVRAKTMETDARAWLMKARGMRAVAEHLRKLKL